MDDPTLKMEKKEFLGVKVARKGQLKPIALNCFMFMELDLIFISPFKFYFFFRKLQIFSELGNGPCVIRPIHFQFRTKMKFCLSFFFSYQFVSVFFKQNYDILEKQ